ncbi:MAG: toll/interleukin-1 receptor domain-containing protein [Odoribacter sp.]
MITQDLIRQLNECIATGNIIGKSFFIARENNFQQCPVECAELGNGSGGRRTFIKQLELLLPLISEDFSIIHKLLIPEVKNLIDVPHHCINEFPFGGITVLLSVIVEELRQKEMSDKKKSVHKIFISHSSKDKDLIESFVDILLRLGIGIKSEDIFCTSIEEMGIKNGEDIRTHIQSNVNGCDYAFLMISSAYQKSEICLNEMGAVWAYDKKVKTFILPDADFRSIGWLYDIKKASKINDSIALDSLYEDMTGYYKLPQKTGEWGRQREIFLNKLNDTKKITYSRI